MKISFVLGLLLGVAGCASEEFHAPLDQNGASPAELCAGADEAGVSGCVLYDSFEDGLDRWHETIPTPDDAIVGLLSVSSDAREGILQIEDCPAIEKPYIETELRLRQAGPFTIRTEWRSAEVDGAALRMFLDDQPLEFPTAATNSPPAWMASTVAASSASTHPILRLEAESLSSTLCAAVWVDWIAVEQ
jgi:hypothetical protein